MMSRLMRDCPRWKVYNKKEWYENPAARAVGRFYTQGEALEFAKTLDYEVMLVFD